MAHGAGWPGAGRPVRVRMDHVLLDEERALVALLAFEALARAEPACDLALVAPAREADGPDARDDLRYLQSAAAAFGATFVRPGAGAPAAVYRRAFAACGRTLLADVPGAAGAGAFATLVLAAEPTEAGAVLAGAPLVVARPAVVGVRLAGELPAGCGGAELLVALARRLEGRARGAVVEFHGAALAAVPMNERIALAALGGPVLGALAVVLPADERTRGYLAARGRDADWRALAGAATGFEFALDFDLAHLAPPPRGRVPLRFGPTAEDDDLRVLAMGGLAGGSLAGVDVVVGGRAGRAALAAGDVLATLAAAGARVLDAADGRALVPLGEGAFACGDEGEISAGRAQPVSAPGALARLGIAATAPPAPAGGGALAAAELLVDTTSPGSAGAQGPQGSPAPGLEQAGAGGPVASPAVERGPRHVLPVLGAPLPRTLRGVVWRCAEPDLPGPAILAWGPRAQQRRGDAAALGALAFGGAGEAALAGEGVRFVATPGPYGAGGPRDAAARALAALGVRAVLAGDFAPGQARALAVQGVLPLRWAQARDAGRIAAGDELELPAFIEALARGGPIVIRNLTRGLALDAHLAVGEEWRAVVQAGGVLALLGRGAPPSGN